MTAAVVPVLEPGVKKLNDGGAKIMERMGIWMIMTKIRKVG
jgi:hypothetical protein